MHHCGRFLARPLTRREMLGRCATGFGAVALWGLLGDKAFGRASGPAPDPTNNPWSPRPPHFSPKVRNIIFLYMDGGQCCFMHPDTYEQTELPRETIGPRASLLLPGMKLSIEFLDGRPVNVVFPDVLEVKVTGTAPPLHQQSDTNFKPARLENGIEVLVPQFVKTGDLIRLHVESMKYMARAETRAKHA